MGLKLSGLASGMDTETMIKELMKAEKTKVDKVEKKKVALEWKKEVWQGFNTKLLAFYNNELFKGKLSSTYSSKKASSSSSLIKASASSTVPAGSHTFKVNQMAKGVNIMSNEFIKADDTRLSASDKVSELKDIGTGDFSIVVNGKAIDIKNSGADDDTTVGQLMAQINNVDGVRASYDEANGRLFISTTGVGDKAELKISSNSLEGKTLLENYLNIDVEERSTLEFNNPGTTTVQDAFGLTEGTLEFDVQVGTERRTVEISGTTTLQELESKINVKFGTVVVAANGNGLKAAVDGLYIKPTAGASDDSNKLANAIRLNNISDQKGTNAKIEYQGQNLEFSSNSISVNGINLELQGANSAESINVTVTDDTEKTVENIKNFVKAYNKLLAEGNKLLYADPVKKYEALTDEEYKALDEETRKTWKEKVQSDMLRGDTKLRSLIQKMREKVSSTGIYGKLAKMGIKTGLYTDKGKLIIDEDKLAKAVKENTDEVTQVFNDLSTDLYDDIKKRIKSTTMSSSLSVYNDKQMDKDIKDYKSKMATLLEKMQDIENRYYKQFAAMESMMAKLNSQQSSFASMLGG